MPTHIVVIDDYHRGLIGDPVAVYDPTAQSVEDESVAETKVVRGRGRPRKDQATEGVETK
jgi:hypothetical protein